MPVSLVRRAIWVYALLRIARIRKNISAKPPTVIAMSHRHSTFQFRSVLALLASLILVVACGGGGGSSENESGPVPNQGGQQQVNDSDGDGVADGQDICADTPADESANVNGCSTSQLDDDGDGVSNGADNCPDTAQDAAVDANGCAAGQMPPDADGDGVADSADQCPATPPDTIVDDTGCEIPNARAGMTMDVTLTSDTGDDADITFTMHEPDVVVPGETYPLMLHSHGYGGSREAARPDSGLLGRFLANGYYLISIDERGHGDSGGTIRILDPDLEGQDLLQVLDWAETNLDQLAYRDDGPTMSTLMDNPVVGAVGGSYGGGYQHLIHAIDDKHRLDAIAPDITWNDLRYSLFSGGVFKTFWATLLSALGNAPGNTQDQEVNEGLVNGLTQNMLTQEQLDLLYRHSLASHCAGANDSTAGPGLLPIDAFLTQSHLDTLFNFNDAAANFACLKALGGDVRLFTKSNGHGIDSGDGGENCGTLARDDMTFRWFEEKLKLITGAADAIPQVCFNLGTEGADAIALADVPIGSTMVTIDQQTLTLAEGSQQVLAVPLYTAPEQGDILAGIPTISLDIGDPTGVNSPAADPILFVGLGVQPAGSDATPDDLMNQIRPFRGFGNFTDQLIGVMSRLEAGDTVVLLLHAAQSDQYFTSGSPIPVPVTIDATVALPLIGSNQRVPGAP